MSRLYVYAAIVAALLLLIAATLVERHRYGDARYAAGEQAGRNAVLADDARAAAELQRQHDQLEQFSALTTTSLHQFLGEKLPANEAQSHASKEAIRIIYRDRPVPADRCSRPAGVQDQLDQAVDAANAAATAHPQL